MMFPSSSNCSVSDGEPVLETHLVPVQMNLQQRCFLSLHKVPLKINMQLFFFNKTTMSFCISVKMSAL